MRFAAVIGLLFLTILGFWACQYTMGEQDEGNSFALNILEEQLPVLDSTYTFMAEDGFQQTFASGTKVTIPGGNLTYKNGHLVNGPVQLSFWEYRDAIDLLAAGISVGTKKGMAKTAGAFRLEIYQAGTPLLFDPTKSIDIRQACYEKEDDYSLFRLEETTNTLDSLFSVRPEINEAHVQLERKLRRTKPQIKFPLDKDHFAFSYKGILDVIYNNNLTNVSHPQTQKKMKQYGLRWSDIQVESFIDYHGRKELASSMIWKNISRKQLPVWTKQAEGTITKINKNRYRLLVQDTTGTKKFSTQLEAVMPLKELFDFGPGYWKNAYKTKVKNNVEGEAQLRMMPSAFRTFRINRLGTYNWQKRSDELESITINAQFKTSESQKAALAAAGIYYLSSDAKGFVHYPLEAWSQLQLFADPGARIFSILADQEIILFPIDELAKIDFSPFKKMDNPSILFKLESTPSKVHSTQELRNILIAEP